ncbi:MAG: hypothetical protein ORN51_03175 [Akkermansiaceae bacterium]|nr:hypothetical protein [Akkermansiaceae bacterium]
MITTSWLAYHRSAEADALQSRHPNAFLLLCQIARRARLTPCKITGLEIGQALIGDFKAAGIKSEQRYRTAKRYLTDNKFVTLKATSRGTVATLMDQGVFSLSVRDATGTPTAEQRASNEQATTKIQCTKKTKETINSISPLDDEILKAIWEATPTQGRQRSSREDLSKAWKKISQQDHPPLNKIITALERWKHSEQWKDQDGKFIPGVHRWITNRRWEDVPAIKTESATLTKLPWE